MTETHSAAHHKIKTIKRSAGHSSVAKAAYIMRAKLQDERTGEWHDYRKKPGLIETGQFNWEGDASSLWNATEKAETNKDGSAKMNAVVARESVYALPSDLPPEVRKRLVIGMCLFKRDRYGCAGTWALHEPDEGGDSRNYHAHVGWTTRAVDADGNFGKTKIRELDDRAATIPLKADGSPALDKKERPLDLEKDEYEPRLDKKGEPVKISRGSYEIEVLRQEWAKRVNRELEKAGIKKRVDHRGIARRIEAGDAPKTLIREPHDGPAKSALKRKNKSKDAVKKSNERKKHNAVQWAMFKTLNEYRATMMLMRKTEAVKILESVIEEQSESEGETVSESQSRRNQPR